MDARQGLSRLTWPYQSLENIHADLPVPRPTALDFPRLSVATQSMLDHANFRDGVCSFRSAKNSPRSEWFG